MTTRTDSNLNQVVTVNHAVALEPVATTEILHYLVDNLVASATPAVAFTSLAGACAPLLGTRCIVDLIEDSGAVYSIERPAHAPSERSPGARTYTVSAAATVPSSSLAAAGGSGYYAQVSVICADGQKPSSEQELVLQHVVDCTVDLVRRERIEAALDAEHTVSAQLRRALDTSRDIGMAIGIMMNASKLTSEEAFDVLARVSQDTNRKLRDVARDLVRTGELPHVQSNYGVSDYGVSDCALGDAADTDSPVVFERESVRSR